MNSRWRLTKNTFCYTAQCPSKHQEIRVIGYKQSQTTHKLKSHEQMHCDSCYGKRLQKSVEYVLVQYAFGTELDLPCVTENNRFLEF